MQSEVLTEPLRIEEIPRTRRHSPADADKSPKAARMAGVQQFFVDWEVPDPS